jgi:hypothetical protein
VLVYWFAMPETKFRSFRVDAVVLRHSNYGEADRLLTVYTREQGKMRILAKGARKIASRKAGHIEPFTSRKPIQWMPICLCAIT